MIKVKVILLLLIDLVALPVVTGQAPIINVKTFDIKNRIYQIESIISSHNHMLYQIQRQLIDIQHDINELRGQTQENQHIIQNVLKYQEYIDKNIKPLIMHDAINKTVNNNSIIDKIYSQTNKLIQEKEIYETAISLANNSKNKQQISDAIIFFQYILNKNKQSNYKLNALFWLGNLYHKYGDKNKAIFYYATFVKNYPKSKKVPELLYNIGKLLKEKGEINNAKLTYHKIIQNYPNSASAQLAKKQLLIL
uniref:Cell division coordinator CpoB n=1 Tax=Candidatus Aschnera chinzeii TaxID=1485666 RepID=A0AAT9G4G0_9ENTR|nr:MAG: cell division protein CpoB [Candidatus Aschnera chinzeii]